MELSEIEVSKRVAPINLKESDSWSFWFADQP